MTTERLENGRFLPGHGVRSPGRPKSIGTDYAKLIRDCLTADAAYRIIEKAITLAQAGCPRSRQWLFAHVVAPIPKTLLVSEEQVASRAVIESALEQMGNDELVSLTKILSAIEPS